MTLTRGRQAIVTAALVLAAASPLACSSASSTTAAPPAVAVPAVAAVAANPVPLLTKAGATLDPGEISGNTDVEGDRYASGSYPGGESIVVYTFATAPAQAANLAANGIPGDAHAFIAGRLVNAYVTAVDAASGYVFTVSPARIAARIGGKVTSP